MGYSEVHTYGSSTLDNDIIAELCNKNNIKIVGSHFSAPSVFEKSEELMEMHRRWGTDIIGIGSMPKEIRNSPEGVNEFIKSFNKAAEIYAKNGFKLTYHNHNFEFIRIDGNKTIMDKLYEGFDPATTQFVLDTGWVAAGCGDVIEWMEKLAGRIDILHLKDMTMKQKDEKSITYSITEVGSGNLAWDRILDCAERIGVKSYVVEQDTNFSPTAVDSLKMSADFLSKYKTK